MHKCHVILSLFGYIPWRKFRIEIHLESIHSEICDRANANQCEKSSQSRLLKIV